MLPSPGKIAIFLSYAQYMYMSTSFCTHAQHGAAQCMCAKCRTCIMRKLKHKYKCVNFNTFIQSVKTRLGNFYVVVLELKWQ